VKQLITTLSILLAAFTSLSAQQWSYVYIQGDKQTPFYVKLEDEMLPRYSKNYCIIPELEAGPIHIQILFQQNEFPPVSFTVLVPEAGNRGFLLTRKEDNFALYDIQQKFYLYPGTSGEDHLPELVTMNTEKTRAAKTIEKEEEAPQPKAAQKREVASLARKQDDDPPFMENVELTNEHTIQPPPPAVTDEPVVIEEQEVAEEEPEPDYRKTEAQINLSANIAPIANTLCPEALDDTEFDKIYTSSMEKKGDEKRISYLMRKAEDNCFSTRQVYFLARQLNAESMRYSFLKKVYPRVTDQQNFRLLENNLFKTLEWKSYFHLIQ
jgi:hypothetical protein